VPTIDPDQIRRNQAEMMGRSAQADAPGRSQAMAQMAQALQDNFGPMAQMKQVHGHLISELLRQRLAVGLAPDGSGNYDISRAPADVRKAITTNSGDSKRKLGLGMEGGALAPGAMGNLPIQAGMDSGGFSVTPDECKYIVMCQFYKIHPRAFKSIGSDSNSLVRAKARPNILTYTPTGTEIMGLIGGITAARNLFDAGSSLTDVLRAVKLRLERAHRGFMAVAATWAALRPTFQCYSQRLSSWARSPQAATEPRLSDSFPTADFLWKQADARACFLDRPGGCRRRPRRRQVEQEHQPLRALDAGAALDHGRDQDAGIVERKEAWPHRFYLQSHAGRR
jgi:hypothetical protein